MQRRQFLTKIIAFLDPENICFKAFCTILSQAGTKIDFWAMAEKRPPRLPGGVFRLPPYLKMFPIP